MNSFPPACTLRTWSRRPRLRLPEKEIERTALGTQPLVVPSEGRWGCETHEVSATQLLAAPAEESRSISVSARSFCSARLAIEPSVAEKDFKDNQGNERMQEREKVPAARLFMWIAEEMESGERRAAAACLGVAHRRWPNASAMVAEAASGSDASFGARCVEMHGLQKRWLQLSSTYIFSNFTSLKQRPQKEAAM